MAAWWEELGRVGDAERYGRKGEERVKGVGEDFAGAGGAGDVGVAAGGEVAGDDRAVRIDEDELGLGAAAVDADFIGRS